MECNGTKKTKVRAVYLSCVLVFFEVIFRINTHLPLFTARFLPIVVFSLCIGGGLAAVFRVLPHVWAKIGVGCALFVLTSCYFIQICYYGVFNTFATFGILVGGTQAVTNFFVIIQGSMRENRVFLCVLFVPLILFVIAAAFRAVCAFCKKKKVAALNKVLNTIPRIHDEGDRIWVEPFAIFEYESCVFFETNVKQKVAEKSEKRGKGKNGNAKTTVHFGTGSLQESRQKAIPIKQFLFQKRAESVTVQAESPYRTSAVMRRPLFQKRFASLKRLIFDTKRNSKTPVNRLKNTASGADFVNVRADAVEQSLRFTKNQVKYTRNTLQNNVTARSADRMHHTHRSSNPQYGSVASFTSARPVTESRAVIKRRGARCFLQKVFVCISMLVVWRVLFLCTVSFTYGTHDGAYEVYVDSLPVTDTVTALGVVASFSRDITRAFFSEPVSIRFTALVAQKMRDNVFLEKARLAVAARGALWGFDSAAESTRGAFWNTDLAADTGALSESLLGFESLSAQAQNVASGTQSEYAVLPIDFTALMQDEADSTYHELDSYFAARIPDKKNEYTGLFRGKNLIYITAESFSPYAVHRELTPTLYKMANEGFVFTNFYTPYWDVSTTDGEYVNLLSLIPKSGTYSMLDSAKNALPFALGNQFRALGYTTKAYHNYIGSYYERRVTHPNLGYDFVSMGEGYRETSQWPDSDYDMIRLTIDDYIEREPFHVYYMTISGHLPYDYYANAMAIKNRALVEHLSLDEPIQAYYACNIELDRALEYLLSKLHEKGIAENTVIVLAADHYPYGLKVKEHNALAGKTLDVTFDLYKNTLIMYNEGQKTTVVTKPCCNMDIVPTLSNLFALPYDSRLFMGHDIFCDTPPFIVFRSKHVLTDKMRYRGTTDTAEALGGNTINEYEVIRAKSALREQIRSSRLVLEKDYYRRIMNHLNGSETAHNE